MKIFIAGQNGLVGSAIYRKLSGDENIELITADRKNLDLEDGHAVHEFLIQKQPDQVILAAALVGGIYANEMRPADFLYKNLQIQNNIIHNCHLCGIDKLLMLGSSCVYPKHASQPIIEAALLTSPLEATNEAYAIAKIAGLKMCQYYTDGYGRDYRALMPSNVYGPQDNFHPQNSHVLPSLINKIHMAKLNNSDTVQIWGSGKPKREFLFSQDLADGCELIINLPKEQWLKVVDPGCAYINIGSGKDISILELAKFISEIIGFSGDIVCSNKYPDGTMHKLLDISKIRALGWSENTSLRDGITKTYKYFIENFDNLRMI